MKFKSALSVLLLALLMFSCGSSKDVVYFQDAQNVPQYVRDNDLSKYEIRIMPNDNLLITVSAFNPEAAKMFNTIQLDRTTSIANLTWQGYLVDQQGYINFPVIGKVKIGGMTKEEAISMLQKQVSEYIENPVVNIRFMNYKVTVLGEVNRPGTYTVESEKVTLPEAIGLAGDMTIYGQRNDVMVARVVNGEKQFYHVDLTNSEVFFSPYYYLEQNDIVYVSPNGTKAGSSTYNQNLPLVVSLISVLITAIALFSK